jgi:hypothetical protein
MWTGLMNAALHFSRVTLDLTPPTQFPQVLSSSFKTERSCYNMAQSVLERNAHGNLIAPLLLFCLDSTLFTLQQETEKLAGASS